MAGRRGHGEGSVFRRDIDGKWLGVLELGRDPQSGRRVRKTVTASTRREAVERLRQLRRDIERILASTEGTTDAALWAMLALCGLRLGEGLGLAEDDVDLSSRMVQVRRTLLHDRTFGPPKSVRGERTVPMPDRLAALLRGHRALIAEQRLAGSEWVDTDALFPTRRGTYPLSRNVQRRFRRLVERLDLPKGTLPHTLRHTWASTLLTSGVPIFLVSRYAGHATIQTTVDQYGHLLPGDDTSAELIRETFDGRLRGSS